MSKNTDVSELLKSVRHCIVEEDTVYCIDENGRVVTFGKPEVLDGYREVPSCVLAHFLKEVYK